MNEDQIIAIMKDPRKIQALLDIYNCFKTEFPALLMRVKELEKQIYEMKPIINELIAS